MQIKELRLVMLEMNSKYMVVVAAMAVMLIGATAFATDSAFAGGKKKYSQATSQANACGNGKLPMNVFCQNIDSQVQGDENGVALTGNQQAQDNGFDGGDHHGGHNGNSGGMQE
jgi:hypothetical protein